MLRLFTWDMAGNFIGAMPYGQAPLGLEGSSALRRPGSKGAEGSKGGGGRL